MSKYDIPLQFTVTRPVPYAPGTRKRGIESCKGPEGCFIQYRGTNFEKDRIKEAADLCGVTYGTFMRSVTNDAANFVLRLKKEQDAQASDE